MKMINIMQDERPITALVFPDGSSVQVGNGTVDGIMPYEENGEMAAVIWFVGLKDGEILYRYNSKYVDSLSYD